MREVKTHVGGLLHPMAAMNQPQSRRRRAQKMTIEKRREQILKVALPMVAKSGSAIKTSDISKAAGIADGTLFRVFQDKQALLDACLEETLDPRGLVQEIVDSLGVNPIEACLEQAGNALIAYFRAALPIMHSILPIARSDAKRETIIAEMFRELMQTTENFMSVLTDRGNLSGEPAQLAQVFVGLAQSSAWQGIFEGGSEASANTFVRVFLDGCRN